jgi:hypothetical protein
MTRLDVATAGPAPSAPAEVGPRSWVAPTRALTSSHCEEPDYHLHMPRSGFLARAGCDCRRVADAVGVAGPSIDQLVVALSSHSV